VSVVDARVPEGCLQEIDTLVPIAPGHLSFLVLTPFSSHAAPPSIFCKHPAAIVGALIQHWDTAHWQRFNTFAQARLNVRLLVPVQG
jgi:hypothetical protein